MEKYIFLCVAAAVILQNCYAPPVTQTKKQEVPEESEQHASLEDYMEYHRYLKEVVGALESDPDFRQKLESANESDIKSGKIAEELEFVSHHVRSQLDEIKRVELERLRELTEKKRQLENNSIDDDPLHHHLDQYNPHTFEINDLKKLIAKTTADLADVDKKRRDEFKRYEMEKEYKKQDKLNHTTGEEHKKLEKQYKEMEEKHKKHEKLHEPGHKAQLEEVWEEQDQMQQDFDPKAFFILHDLDGNGLWDQNEVKALFVKELNKMYEAGAPEDDMREKYEEMERMRETVFSEMDKNRDGFIEYEEFMQQTNTAEFKEDHGWKSIDEQSPYSDQELEEYIRQHNAYRVSQGLPQIQVPPGGYPEVPPGAYHPQVNQQIPPGGHHPQANQQIPPGGYHPQENQQIPPGGYHPQGNQQIPAGGYHPQENQQIPPGGYHPQENQQIPPGGYHPQGNQQIPPGGYHPQGNQQIPAGGYHPQGYQQIPAQQGGYQQHGQVAQNVEHLPNLNTNEIHQQYPAQPHDQNQPNSHQIKEQHHVNQQQTNQQPPQVNYQVNQQAQGNQQPPQGNHPSHINQQQPNQQLPQGNYQQGQHPSQINQQQPNQQHLNLPPQVQQQH